jgi:hypothetical protein
LTASEGIITIEPLRWQTISIPSIYGGWNTTTNLLERGAPTLAKVKEYIIDQLEDKYGAGVILRISRFWGDDNAWVDFIPGVTLAGSPNNFELMPLDADTGQREPQGFLLYSNHPTNMALEWKTWLT